jgi:hypothetical protein
MQRVKDALPTGELEFEGQVQHDFSMDIPVVFPYLPAPQAVHDASAVCPAAAPYLPAPQTVHDASVVCPVAFPYLPAPQAVHDASAVCPVTVPYLPAPQSVQFPKPPSDFHLPATHAMQGPPAGYVLCIKVFTKGYIASVSTLNETLLPFTSPAAPEKPRLQVQLVIVVLPAGELEFDGQMLHVELAEAPNAVEYVPAPQSVHATEPVDTLYFPAKHDSQLLPSGVHPMSFTASMPYHSALVFPIVLNSSRIVRVL